MPIYPDTILHEIRSRVSITQVVGESVRLDKRGNRYLGLCPFHNEKTPSFNVNPDLGYYHCFGCGAKGDIFSFLQKRDGLNFPETVEKLAHIAGVQLPARESNAKVEAAQAEKERYFRATQLAAQYYTGNLLSGDFPEPLAYLAQRGVSLDTAKAFGLGYAPTAWDGLLRFAQRKKVPVADLVFAGLAKKREKDDGHFDLFRNRLMFPVRDLSKRVVAFSGRTLDAQEKAKYINSPETAYYRKAHQLFGIDLAQSPIKTAQRAILVEGNFDVVSLHARGVSTAVAPLGTALTVEQVRLLRRFTKSVVLFFDGDNAGRNAARKALDTLLEADFPEILYAPLPDGADPDDVARRGGADAVNQLLRQAKPLLDTLIEEQLLPAMGAASPGAKAAAITELVPLMQKIRDTTLLEAWIQEIARRTGLSSGELARRFRPPSGGGQRGQGRNDSSYAPTPARPTPATAANAGPDDPFDDGPLPVDADAPPVFPKLSMAESELVVILHRRPTLLLPFLHDRTDLIMAHQPVASWLHGVAAGYQQDGPPVSKAFEELEEGPLKDALSVALISAGPVPDERVSHIFQTLTNRIRREWVDSARRRILTELQEAERRQDIDACNRLMAQLTDLDQFARTSLR